MSCIYGARQLGTEDQGWVAHFLRQARAGRPITIYGDGRQVRDVLYVEDLVAALLAGERALSAPGGERLADGRQRFTLNLTRADMRKAGWSPSVRLFEAACAGAPILTDDWEGLEAFFTPGEELLVVRSSGDVLEALDKMSENDRRALAARARRRVLAEHTAAHRAATLVGYVHERRGRGTTARRAAWPGSL